MFVLEFKVRGKESQYRSIDEAIRTSQFVRNKCLRFWIDNRGIGKYDLYKHNTALRREFPFVQQLNSHACQVAVERAWTAIARFYENCQKNVSGKKAERPLGGSLRVRTHQAGYPKFKKHSRSVEYKVSGWKLSEDKKRIAFTDKKGIGQVKLIGSRDLNYFQVVQIKRVRLLRRADGYYCQFLIKKDPRDSDITKAFSPSKRALGIDLGLKYFFADSDGFVVHNPRFYLTGERRLRLYNRQLSRRYRNPKKGKKGEKMVKGGFKQSNNYHKARIRYARKHLRVSRQREEYCKRAAYCVIQSNDLVAYEDLNVKGMIRNRRLAKSIADAGWSTFRKWLEYFGFKYGKVTVAVPPHNTSQNCSNCGEKVTKSLSTRTHICPNCGYVEDRDVNAAINILNRGLSTVGHTGTYAWGKTPSWSVGSDLLANGDLLNQESPRL